MAFNFSEVSAGDSAYYKILLYKKDALKFILFCIIIKYHIQQELTNFKSLINHTRFDFWCKLHIDSKKRVFTCQIGFAFSLGVFAVIILTNIKIKQTDVS